MSKKSDDFYFDNFIECAECSCQAADALKTVFSEFNVDTISARMQQLHEIETKGDGLKHVMTVQLVKSFITPIDRDDIMAISQCIDNVTDSVEDIVIKLYTNNVTSIRSDSAAFCDLLIRSCQTMKLMLEEFKNFKKSKKLSEYIVELNDLEESGDRMYISSMKELHTTVSDPVEIIAWREIYHYFEKCFDACEDVSDIIEGIAIKNL